MTERKTGYILLIAGIIIMIYSATQIIAVFTGRAKPIEVVDYQMTKKESPTDKITQQFQLGALPTTPSFDQESLNELINLSIYYFIMQFLMGLGYKFSNLGVSMLRPIVVKVRNKELESVVAAEEAAETTK